MKRSFPCLPLRLSRSCQGIFFSFALALLGGCCSLESNRKPPQSVALTVLDITGQTQSPGGEVAVLNAGDFFLPGSWGATSYRLGDNRSLLSSRSSGMGGVYFKMSNGLDLTAFKNGQLKFELKSPSNPKLLIKLEAKENSSSEVALANYAKMNNEWEAVSIPLADFSGLEFSKIAVIFGAYQGEGEVEYKNIRWEVRGDASSALVEKRNPAFEHYYTRTLSTPDYPKDTHRGPGKEWKLVWSDEFNGEALDTNNWSLIQLDPPYNNELQYYTSTHDQPGSNIWVQDGYLTIEARREDYRGYQYTSGRLESKGKQSFKYGRIEARIKHPSGNGVRALLWTLGSNIEQVGWPACGEFVVAATNGRQPHSLHTVVDQGRAWNDHLKSQFEYLREDLNFHEEFHVFAVEWDEDVLHWELDGKRFQTFTREEHGKDFWALNNDFFFIINLAVGGKHDNMNAPSDAELPTHYVLDWLRVYQKQ